MPHARAVEGKNNVEIDYGIVLENNSFVNINVLWPKAKVALEKKEIETLDAVPPPAPLSVDSVLRFYAHNELEYIEELLEPEQFAFFLDPTEGATKLHIVSKDKGGTVRKAEIAMA
jgi:hypothetical protein